ncbi:MAG: DNA polymerase II large subunit [Candidatus Marsarchaeota archaeon]|nr:DNA polymerase II large subunit [Candidatus Marsarchaeota archaeon]MCL5418877.1 DNA polymerase II large subunit [Candidatus Marsarchaeota archaeon]
MEYFDLLNSSFAKTEEIAKRARSKGYDIETDVEIKPAPDMPARVEGITGIKGVAEKIRSKQDNISREALAFELVKDICSDDSFGSAEQKLAVSVKVGLAILTEGIVVAPTEGMQGCALHKNPDGTEYAAVLYAGPIRGAGGTGAALSVALADYGRRLLNIGAYKPQQNEIERYVEEVQIYNAVAKLQYVPREEDLRTILGNCPVCIDGLPTERVEVGVHRNIKRLTIDGKEEYITNRVRGGVALVLCEGIAQKAKSVLKHTKNIGLDWSWLNDIIKIDKVKSGDSSQVEKDQHFLQELVAGRPILAYPGHAGAFRLRYGRSRLTGIAAKGFNPATMVLLGEFIASGTQLKIDKPGKGCVAAPADSIEGPFVKLENGEALRINSAEKAYELKDKVRKILAVGDILVTFGDFKKTNTQLQPTSYVEEYWLQQLLHNSYKGSNVRVETFKEAYELSSAYNVPMHPRYIYEYTDITPLELKSLAEAVSKAKIKYGEGEEGMLLGVEEIDIQGSDIAGIAEKLCLPHLDKGSSILVRGDDAQSLIASLGFANGARIEQNSRTIEIGTSSSALEEINKLSPFKIMPRSTRIGARIGRPEKAKERLMKPAPNSLFPIGDYGGKDRSIYKAYNTEKTKFNSQGIDIEIARFRCEKGGELVPGPFCNVHNSRAVLERICPACGRKSNYDICPYCGSKTQAFDIRKIDIVKLIDNAMKGLKLQELPKTLKGVKGVINKYKVAEPIEKGLLRALHNVHPFKDGTSRFDATDMPMTHFYPIEIGTSVEKLKELGYATDYKGNELADPYQLVELRHQDVIINRHGAEFLLSVSKFIDDLLARYYGLEPFYNAKSAEDLVGQLAITLSPHTSVGILNRIIGFTNANVGFAHPYTIAARRRNCDGDEDTTILLLDALINFSRSYLPTTIGGTMDAPLILTLNVNPSEVDDEVHEMEVTESYGIDFYDKTYSLPSPSEAAVETVKNRLGSEKAYSSIMFTHETSYNAVESAPKKSMYTRLNSMPEKVEAQFRLADMLESIDKQDSARKLILSHFIPDLIGNMHSYSKQTFRCISCNAKYRRVPLIGRCTRCGGKLVLTISKGGIEKYLTMAIGLADRYDLEPYIRQRLKLIKDEIENIFSSNSTGKPVRQFNLSKYM